MSQNWKYAKLGYENFRLPLKTENIGGGGGRNLYID